VSLLNPVYEAVAWVLKQIYYFLSPIFGPASGWTWALSIVILVVLMRLIMVPLFVKQMHTTRAMSALAPQMTALRKKYKNDKQTLQQETMKLYQEAGVNPLMGCLPVVLQLPVFFALFSVLRAIAEWKPGQAPKYGLTYQMVATARHAKILGVTISDKFLFSSTTPLHAKVVIFVFVLISMATTYLTVRQSMKRGMMPAATPDNPMGQSQKYMMYIMPVFALSGLYWPFGLVLYWVTTNVWTLGQQWFLFRNYPKPAAAGAAGAAAPAIAPTVTAKPKRPLLPGSRQARGAGNQDAAKSDGASQANGAARSGGAARGNANGSPSRSARKAAGSPAGSSAGQGAQPSANGGGAGGMLRRLGKGRAEPEPPPPEPEVKLVRQQKQRQSRSKRSGKR
jgi:YidC/Oxa1 family membrane protein insertase